MGARDLALLVLAGCGRIGFAAVGPTDANGDGATSDGNTAGFCASQTGLVFCSDFDDGQGITAWTASSQSMGTLTVDGAEARSAPYSMRVDTTTIPSGQHAGVGVAQHNVGSNATHVVASFSVLVDSAGTSDALLFALGLVTTTEEHDLEIVDRNPPSGVYIEDVNIPMGMGPVYNFYNTGPMSNGAWHRLVLDYTAGAAAQLVLSIDGTPVISMTPVFTTGGNPYVELGMVYMNGPATPWQLHFDDFTLAVQ